MHILFVAMASSIHTARWINQLADANWDIHLFPVQDADIHPELKNITVHDNIIRFPGLPESVTLAGTWPWPLHSNADRVANYLKRTRRSSHLSRFTRSRAERLAHLVQKLKPDIVHSLEMQHAGYLTLEAKKNSFGSFPPWVVTNWGSDIYLFGRLSEHKERVKAVLGACDYYSCECQRDVKLAQVFGLKGKALAVLPVAGGFRLDYLKQFRQPGPISTRRLIVLKGYQSWAGRALAGLRAIALCADVLQDYEVAIYLATPDVELAAELTAEATGIPIEIVPRVSHEELLRLHGQARVSIGLSISDAISTSFLEAITMGSFPVQSNTSCANEWVDDGQTGILVPPEDPEIIAAAIRRAVTDDEMVDNAAEINAGVVAERLDYATVKSQVIDMYQNIVAERKILQ